MDDLEQLEQTQTELALSYLTPDQRQFLTFLTSIGVGVATLAPLKVPGTKEFNWTANNDKRPSLTRLKTYRPGNAIVAATDGPLNVIDVDPRNGGQETFDKLKEFLPPVIAKVATPDHGFHFYVQSIGAPTTKCGGIDYLGAKFQVFTLGTSRPKYGNRGYELLEFNTYDPAAIPSTKFYDQFVLLKRTELQSRAFGLGTAARARAITKYRNTTRGISSEQGQLYGPYGYIQMGMSRIIAEPTGSRHDRLWIESFKLGHFNIEDTSWLGRVTDALSHACEESGFARDHRSSMYQTISDGFITGQTDQLIGEEK